MMQNFRLDLRYSFRSIRKNWGFSLLVILTLALGIGANSLVYSIVDSVILNPFPFPILLCSTPLPACRGRERERERVRVRVKNRHTRHQI